MDAAMRSHRKNDSTINATGINNAQKYPGQNGKQICLAVSDEMFSIVKAEAVRQECSIGEVVRQCLELVFK